MHNPFDFTVEPEQTYTDLNDHMIEIILSNTQKLVFDSFTSFAKLVLALKRLNRFKRKLGELYKIENLESE